jgi:hypothetical protein
MSRALKAVMKASRQAMAAASDCALRLIGSSRRPVIGRAGGA